MVKLRLKRVKDICGHKTMIAQSNQLSKPYDWRYAVFVFVFVFALVLVFVLSWLYVTLNAIKQTGLLLFQRILAGALIAGFGK
jgi:hypothetical protein